MCSKRLRACSNSLQQMQNTGTEDCISYQHYARCLYEIKPHCENALLRYFYVFRSADKMLKDCNIDINELSAHGDSGKSPSEENPNVHSSEEMEDYQSCFHSLWSFQSSSSESSHAAAFHICALMSEKANLLCVHRWMPTATHRRNKARSSVYHTPHSLTSVQLSSCSSWGTFPLVDNRFFTLQLSVSPWGVTKMTILLRPSEHCQHRFAHQTLVLSSHQEMFGFFNDTSDLSIVSAIHRVFIDFPSNVIRLHPIPERNIVIISLVYLATEIRLQRVVPHAPSGGDPDPSRAYFSLIVKTPSSFFTQAAEKPNYFASTPIETPLSAVSGDSSMLSESLESSSICSSGCSAPLQLPQRSSHNHLPPSFPQIIQKHCRQAGLTGLLLDLCVTSFHATLPDVVHLQQTAEELKQMLGPQAQRLLQLNRTHVDTTLQRPGSDDWSSQSSSGTATVLHSSCRDQCCYYSLARQILTSLVIFYLSAPVTTVLYKFIVFY